MSLDRYLRDDEGFRKYVELIESMPTMKRKTLLESAKSENKVFAETAEKYVLTIERITRLPELELTEVLGSPSLKPKDVGTMLSSIEDVSVRENLLKLVPRNLAANVVLEMKDNPTPEPFDVGAARLKVIKAARELEKHGKLESVQIPRFTPGQFRKRIA